MGLEDFSPDIESSEWGFQANEKVSEVSEKIKESSKKAAAWVKRTKQDEQKAKKYDFLLAWFLVKIIVDKKYDFILEELFKVINHSYPSNFVLWVLSLINIEISNKIRENINKELINFSYKSLELKDFDDTNIDLEVKNRINYWIEDIIDSVTIEYSSIQTLKIIELLENDNDIIVNYIANIMFFFLKSVNIKINKKQALNISDFIISETLKSIKKLNIEEV